jgi:hypothetical protein
MKKNEEVKNKVFTYVSKDISDDWEKFKFHYKDGNLERIEKYWKEGGIHIYIDEALEEMKEIVKGRRLFMNQCDDIDKLIKEQKYGDDMELRELN